MFLFCCSLANDIWNKKGHCCCYWLCCCCCWSCILLHLPPLNRFRCSSVFGMTVVPRCPVQMSRISASTVLQNSEWNRHLFNVFFFTFEAAIIFSFHCWNEAGRSEKLKHIFSPFSQTHTNRVRPARVRLIVSLGTSGPLEVAPPFFDVTYVHSFPNYGIYRTAYHNV